MAGKGHVHSFIYLLSKYLLNAYYVPGRALGTGTHHVRKTDHALALRVKSTRGEDGEQENKQTE